MSFTSFFTGHPQEDYPLALQQLPLLLEGESNWVANLSNCSSLLNQCLTNINWVGFYLLDLSKPDPELVLGPFQGLPACLRIPFGKGVCGSAALTQKTQVVPDVDEFPGHIACDSQSKSEIVIPLIDSQGVWGVLDIDSPIPDRFGIQEVDFLDQVGKILCETIQYR
jgi:L-methionine (R)-S-oxide reductase